MNFIEAHKIVHDYCDAIGKPTDKNALLFRPISNCSFLFDKDQIIQAYKIFYSHMIFFGTRTQSEYTRYDMCLNELDHFVSDEIYNDVIRSVKISTDKSRWNKIKNRKTIPVAKIRMEKYLQQSTDNEGLLNTYRKKEVEEYFVKMQNIRVEVLDECMRENPLEYKIKYLSEYCKRAYIYAKEPFKEEYLRYYFSFDALRKLLFDEQYKPFLQKYYVYIMHSQ